MYTPDFVSCPWYEDAIPAANIVSFRCDVENRMRILRLIENMTLGRNAVGYLTESMHGAGSPQAQRIQIARQMQLGYKMNLAKKLARVKNDTIEPKENSDYFKRVFKII